MPGDEFLIPHRSTTYGLLVVDELGYAPFAKDSEELLFQVLAERHERGSVIITTNRGFADRTQVFAVQPSPPRSWTV